MSRGDLYLLVAMLAAFGIVTSAYLTWQWYEAAGASWCDLDAYFSCTKVRESPWASVADIPTATVGVVGFGVLLVLGLAGLRGWASLGPWPMVRWLLGFSSAGVAIGTGLTLVEVFVIQAVCVLCVLAVGLGLGAFGGSVGLVRIGRAPS
jgi:uncharacterized membrane protein